MKNHQRDTRARHSLFSKLIDGRLKNHWGQMMREKSRQDRWKARIYEETIRRRFRRVTEDSPMMFLTNPVSLSITSSSFPSSQDKTERGTTRVASNSIDTGPPLNYARSGRQETKRLLLRVAHTVSGCLL